MAQQPDGGFIVGQTVFRVDVVAGQRVGGGQAAEMILDASAYGFGEAELIAEVMADAPPAFAEAAP